MAIKTIVENLESVPEGLREHYTESEGQYVLNVDGIDAHPDVSNLRNAYQRVKAAEKAARSELESLQGKASELPEDFDPDLWQKAKSGELEKGLVEVRKGLESELQKERDKAAALEQSLRGLTVDRALSDALDAANIREPAFRKAATVLLRDGVKLDGEKVYVDSDMGPIEPVEYVKKWAATDEGKPFVSQPSGGGSKPGNPSVTGTVKSWADAKTTKERVEYLKSNPS